MIYKTISRMELNIPIPGGEQVRLRAYLRPEQGFVADDGARWAVIVCPGGGYGLVAPGEGEPVALAFLAAGIQAFVLDYSVAPVRYPAALMELAASVAWVRDHALEYGVAPDRVAVCGFSAGDTWRAALQICGDIRYLLPWDWPRSGCGQTLVCCATLSSLPSRLTAAP